MSAAKKILLIDDSEIDNYLNTLLLSRLKFEKSIVSLQSGQEALKYLNSRLDPITDFPDVILLDLRMPIMDGFQFMEEYNKLPADAIAKCSVMVLSSSIDPIDIKTSNKTVNVKKYITKPLRIAELEKLFEDL